MSRVQFRILTVTLALGAGGAAFAAFSEWRAGAQTCAVAREFADSVASNRVRLAGVDSVIRLFDLEQNGMPDPAAGPGAPNRLERQIIEFRMAGVTAAQLNRWLTQDMHFTPAAADSGAVAKIHAYERDTAYIAYLRKTLQLTNDHWHDLSVLPPLAERWRANCAAPRPGLAIALAACGVLTALLALAVFRFSPRSS